MIEAIEKDVNQKYLEAVKLYEDKISNTEGSLDIYINLAFLYWQFASDFGFAKYHQIEDYWRERGAEKYPELINQARKKYPDSLELKFWEKYFPYRHFNDEFTREECEKLIDEYSSDKSIVPYFFLYLFDEEKYKEERDTLLKQCGQLPTAKNRYIRSIIE